MVRVGAGSASPAAEDSVLWAALGAGDPDGLGGLFDRHSRAVYNFAFRRTASWSHAEDITQATFVTTWRRAVAGSLPELEQPTALPWLLGVAGQESRNVQRSSARRHRLGARLHLMEDRPRVDVADDVAGRLDDERQMAELRAAVEVLPPHERVVLELVTWAGLTVSEAASTLGVAEGTVKSRMARARHRLGSFLTAAPEGGPR